MRTDNGKILFHFIELPCLRKNSKEKNKICKYDENLWKFNYNFFQVNNFLDPIFVSTLLNCNYS